MILCHRDYVSSSTLFTDPIPDEMWSRWVDELNANIRYCKSLPMDRVMDFVGKCEPEYLPSEHPYWALKVSEDLEQANARHLSNLKKIEADPSLLPILYNSSTSIKNIMDGIDRRNAEIKRLRKE